MILIDTSLWIDHLHHPIGRLVELLANNAVLMHPFIMGEIAMGSLRDRERVLRYLNRFPVVLPARNYEVLALVAQFALHGTGIGFIDAHLLASARMVPGTTLMTRDRRLAAMAERVGVADRP